MLHLEKHERKKSKKNIYNNFVPLYNIDSAHSLELYEPVFGKAKLASING